MSEKRRRRPPLACVACRRRKVRCDRKLPCQNCSKARRAASCAYVPDERLEPRETTRRLTNGIDRQNTDTDGVVRVTVGSGPVLGPGTITTSSSLHSNSNQDGEGETLRDRVRQLEKQLEQVLDAKRADTNAVPSNHSAPLLHNNSGSSVTRDLGQEWECSGTRRSELLNTEPTGPSGTRPMLVKSRYLGGSHWMRGMSLVSLNLFRLSWLCSRVPRRL